MVHVEPTWSAVTETLKHRAAVHAIETATKLHLREHGLTTPEFLLLAALADELNATARPTDLACRIGLTTGGITRLVDRCVNRGYVRRKANEGDDRSCLVWMTLLGQQRLEAATPGFSVRVRDAIGGAA
jgi:DNA-binding MarR family transcriptional regulator